MKKGILSTILVIQLILLTLLTFSNLQARRTSFSLENQYRRISAYRISSAFNDISSDLLYLKEKNANEETITSYISLINKTFENEFLMEISINESYILIKDEKLEIVKGGWI